MKKPLIITIVVVVLLIAGYFMFFRGSSTPAPVTENPTPATTPANGAAPTQSPVVNSEMTVIGQSVQGRDIQAFHYGTGTTEILFVGGIHGGYEWNTALVAFKLQDYLKKNPSVIPSNVKVTVIPLLNPDGFFKVIGSTSGDFDPALVTTSQTKLVSGRYNGNGVDLNRNFDCDWQAKGKWQSTTVSGGDSAFSEPESQAMESYVTTNKPTAVVVWYSAAGGVYASNCHNGVSTETNALTQAFAKASGYPAHQSFDFYATTGDMTNWLAKNSIPAISVLLTNHTDPEWTMNLAGVKAVLNYYAK